MRAPPSAADRSNLGWGSQALAGSTKQLSNRTSSSHRSSSGLFTISKTLISNLGRSLICFQLLSPEIRSLAAHNRSISRETIPTPTRSTSKGFHLHRGSHCCYSMQGEKAWMLHGKTPGSPGPHLSEVWQYTQKNSKFNSVSCCKRALPRGSRVSKHLWTYLQHA